MERGLSGFCQSFDGVIDCERYQGQGARIQTEMCRTKKDQPQRYKIIHHTDHK